MNKVIVAIIAVLLGLSIAILIASSQKQKTTSSLQKPLLDNPESITPSILLKKYEDPSGFTFQYPKDIIVSAKKLPSNNFYAYVEATSPAKTGKVIISIESSNLNSIDDWVVQNSKKISKTINKIKLSELEGQEYDTTDSHISVALDQGALIIIKSPVDSDKESWSAIHKSIVSSFSFAQPSPSENSSQVSGGGDDVTYEGEETVE